MPFLCLINNIIIKLLGIIQKVIMKEGKGTKPGGGLGKNPSSVVLCPIFF